MLCNATYATYAMRCMLHTLCCILLYACMMCPKGTCYIRTLHVLVVVATSTACKLLVVVSVTTRNPTQQQNIWIHVYPIGHMPANRMVTFCSTRCHNLVTHVTCNMRSSNKDVIYPWFTKPRLYILLSNTKSVYAWQDGSGQPARVKSTISWGDNYC